MPAERNAPRVLEGDPFFLGVLAASVVLPALMALGSWISTALPLSLTVEIVLGLPAVVFVAAAAILFDRDGFTEFLRRSIWIAYLLKYIAIPYALCALQLTVAFAMQAQDGGPSNGNMGAGFEGIVVASVVWFWLIAAASFLAGDARIGMIRRERKSAD